MAERSIKIKQLGTESILSITVQANCAVRDLKLAIQEKTGLEVN